METSGRNKWLNSFVKFKSDEEPNDYWRVNRQVNGWCKINNLKSGELRIVKSEELIRVKIIDLTLPFELVNLVFNNVKNGSKVSIKRSSPAVMWEKGWQRSNKCELVHIINSKIEDNLYFTFEHFCKETDSEYTATMYGITFCKLIFQNKKMTY